MVKQWKLKTVVQQIKKWKTKIQFLYTSHSFSYDRNPYSLSTLKINVSVLFYDFVLCFVFFVRLFMLFLVSFSLPLSSLFCVEKDLLCSSERCFVYYLKIQATESFEISQKSVQMNIVTNILLLFIIRSSCFIVTIFRSFSSRTPCKFQVYFQKKYCYPLRSIGQLSFRTPCLF